MTLFYGLSSYAQIGINTNNPQALFHIDAKGDTNGNNNVSDDLVVDDNGNMGIGTLSPTARLHTLSESPFKIQDGNERIRKVLRCDATGLATWSSVSSDGVVGVLGDGADVYLPDVYYKSSGSMPASYTGSYIELPPGRWIVYATCVVPPVDLTKHIDTPAYWIRSTFYDIPPGTPPAPVTVLSTFIADIERGTQISIGGWFHMPALISGFTVINNTTLVSKKYYYVVGIITTGRSLPYTIKIGGKTDPENNLVAFKLQ